MSFLAGETITAARLNRLQTVTYEGVATSTLTMTTTTETDITGATVTFTTTAANAVYEVMAVFDASVLATSTTILMYGKLSVDGSTQTATAVHAMDTLDRDTVAMVWTGTLASAGSHTIKLRGNLSGALATGGSFLLTNTKFTCKITEVA